MIVRRRSFFAAGLLFATLLAACGDDEAPPEPEPVNGASIESIRTEDGLRLDARLFRAEPAEGSRRLVILLHMYPADQSSWYGLARDLQADGGSSALTLDFRGYGASEGPKDVAKIDRDVRAAIAFARQRGFESIALVGASMGGTAAIMVAAEASVAGVITLSAPVSFRGLDAEAAVQRLSVPLAVLAARGDTAARHSLETFSEQAGLDARHAVLYQGRAHGTDLLTGKTGDEVRTRLRELLDEIWSR